MMKRQLLCALLVAALLCAAVLLAQPTAAWADVTATKPTQGNGAADNPYQISTAGELYWFAGLVNGTLTGVDKDLDACAVLTADITINEDVLNDENGTLNGNGTGFEPWTPIGDSSNRYIGTFDGNGHTISGLYINNSTAKHVGLFGYIDAGGTVKNLTLADSYVRTVTDEDEQAFYAGGICATNRGSITDCSISGMVSCEMTKSDFYHTVVGGICAENNGTISYCSNNSTVSGAGTLIFAGGICGINDEGQITKCANSGTISGINNFDDEEIYAGGICGYNKKESSISDCSNSGSVKAAGTRSTSNPQAGGVCGCNSGTIAQCYNAGTVEGIGKDKENVNVYAGGICGIMSSNGIIKNCSNSGKVCGIVEQPSSYISIGGICGWIGGTYGGRIEYCSNNGAVTFEGSVSGSAPKRIGGIVGQTEQSGTITNCYFLEGTAEKAVGLEAGVSTNVAEKTEDEYLDTNGDNGVLYLLNQQSAPDAEMWVRSSSGYPIPKLSVISISLDAAELTLMEDDGTQLESVIKPDFSYNKNVSWKSADEKVATVDNGTVTAVGAGETTITVTTADGSKTATCKVKVTAKIYKISANITALNFGSVTTGYTQPDAQTVTITNDGNQFLTLTQPESTSSFEVGTLSKTDLAVGEAAAFTVQPKAGLAVGTYNEDITVSGTGGATMTIPASFTVKSRPSYNPPTVSEKTIAAIKAAQPGETVTVDLSHGSTKLDKEVFETLAGKDITLAIDLGDGVSWTVNGTDIPEDADFVDIDMGVTMNSVGIPVDLINAITGEHGSVQMTLAHDGAFGFTMTLTAPLGVENAGYWANLYYFDEDAEQLTFETAAEIDADGSVSLSLSHASQYAIVIDDHNHGVVTLPFTDVSDSDWFYDPVCFVYSQGLMTGTSENTFEPNTPLSRAMLVAVLHRLEGSPAASGGDFTDVSGSDWYATAVNWAAASGITSGTGDGNFSPNTAITREQLAAILMNYAQYKGQDTSARATLDTYSDATAISSWANDVMSWAVAEGLLTGVTADTLQPQGAATRAQVAAILQRFLSE